MSMGVLSPWRKRTKVVSKFLSGRTIPTERRTEIKPKIFIVSIIYVDRNVCVTGCLSLNESVQESLAGKWPPARNTKDQSGRWFKPCTRPKVTVIVKSGIVLHCPIAMSTMSKQFFKIFSYFLKFFLTSPTWSCSTTGMHWAKRTGLLC